MAIGYLNNGNLTTTFNSTYKINLDVSGWDKVTIQTVAPVLGTINIMGSNDAGSTAYNQGNASLAINWSPLQAKNLQTGTMVNAIYGAGLFQVDVNARFLSLQGVPAGSPTSVYRINLFNSKID